MSTRSKSSRPTRTTAKRVAAALKRKVKRQVKATRASSEIRRTSEAIKSTSTPTKNPTTSTGEDGDCSEDSDITTDVYVVDQILKMEEIDSSWMCLVSWVGYDDATWEPEKHIPPAVVKKFKSVTKQHSVCTSNIKECLDMVDCSRNKDDVLWLCQVSWNGCSHTTWELESNIDPSIVAAFRYVGSDVGEGELVVDVESSKAEELAKVEGCAKCGVAGGLGRQCETCKQAMHHYCATDVCTLLDLKDVNGNKMVEFPNDATYCSSDCYYGTNTRPPTETISTVEAPVQAAAAKSSLTTLRSGGASGKRKRAPIYSDSSESDSEEDSKSNKRRACTRKGSDEDYAPVKTKVLSTIPLVDIAPKVPEVVKITKKTPSKRAKKRKGSAKDEGGNLAAVRDPMINQMVAYCADQEDWMETTRPIRKTKKGKLIIRKDPPLYEQAKGNYLPGRIHRAVAKDDEPDKIYEVRWTQTGFQSSKHVHRLTLAQVKRGIANYEVLTGKRLTKATFENICKVPDSEQMDVNVSLDDCVVHDGSISGSINDLMMERMYPENLKGIEDLKTLDFNPSRKLQAPNDLYTHDDGTTDTKIKKDKMHLFQTASSSFFAYLPLPFWHKVVEETNKYAAADKGANITLDELIKVIGIMFYMTVVSKGEYANYWGEQIEGQILGVGQPGLETIMPLKRFVYIRKNLCFRYEVKDEDLKRDPAARIRPLINTLKATCPLYVELGRDVAVDESSIACRSKYGRHLIVFNSTKPTGKYHFKIYACCCASSWLMISFRLHCNSTMQDRLKRVVAPTVAEQLEADTQFSSAVRKIVLEVTQPLHQTKRIVNTDNFYTSVQLLSSLRSIGMYGRGTIKRGSLHFPVAHMIPKNSSEARGTSLQGVCVSERIVAASWRDGTTVNVISNADPSSMGEVTRLVGQVSQTFPAPACIAQYNKYMQGVDRLDQLRAKYSIADGHSMKKWHKKLALAFIDIARVNAYITKRLRDNNRASRNPHREFMAELASEMISGRWRESVDDGGFYLADLELSTTASQSSTPSIPPTPTVEASACTFDFSIDAFPEASRGKRGCKVCLWEGRNATMMTSYCKTHNVCLCLRMYKTETKFKAIACPYEEWTCWRKFHEYYLPRGLFNENGRIKRKSKMNIVRRGLELNALNRVSIGQASTLSDTSFISTQINADRNEDSVTSPPTYVVSPFDGVLQNAQQDACKEESSSPPPDLPVTPSLTVALSVFSPSNLSNISRDTKSIEFET